MRAALATLDAGDSPAWKDKCHEAAALRARAFLHLEHALRFGFRDRKHLGSDPDLEPLRAEATRWEELRGRIGR